MDQQTIIRDFITRFQAELPTLVLEKRMGIPRNTLNNLRLINRPVPKRHLPAVLTVLHQEGLLPDGRNLGDLVDELLTECEAIHQQMKQLLTDNGLTLNTICSNAPVYTEWSRLHKQSNMLSNRLANLINRR